MARCRSRRGRCALQRVASAVGTRKCASEGHFDAAIARPPHPSSAPTARLLASQSYELTYSVTWVPTTKAFADRFSRYLDNNFFEHQIHWFSLFNSFMVSRRWRSFVWRRGT